MSKEFSLSDVAEHNTKNDIYLVVHDKVYNCTSFVDEHPGGEEVMLDVAGQDATEAFEDVGHSDEARETLEKLLIGTLKRQPGDPAPKSTSPACSGPKNADQTGMGVTLYFIILLGGAAAYFAFQYMAKQKQD